MGKKRNAHNILLGKKLKGRENLEDPGEDGKVIFD
jgi:hypothetical protein